MVRPWRIIPLLIFVVLCGFLWRGLSLNPRDLPSVKINQPLPSFFLPGLQHEGGLSSEMFKNHVVILNVWASWCNACLDEQVFLLQLARKNVRLYGLNYKDSPSAAQQWLSQWGNPYRAIGVDAAGKVAMDLGVYGAPETFLIDKKGRIRYRYAGILDERVWQQEFLPRINALEKNS